MCDLKCLASWGVSRNMKSSGKRSKLRFYSLVKGLGRHLIESRQIGVQHYLLRTHQIDATFNHFHRYRRFRARAAFRVLCMEW